MCGQRPRQQPCRAHDGERHGERGQREARQAAAHRAIQLQQAAPGETERQAPPARPRSRRGCRAPVPQPRAGRQGRSRQRRRPAARQARHGWQDGPRHGRRRWRPGSSPPPAAAGRAQAARAHRRWWRPASASKAPRLNSTTTMASASTISPRPAGKVSARAASAARAPALPGVARACAASKGSSTAPALAPTTPSGSSISRPA